MAIRRKPNKTVARAKAKPASALGRALRERDEAQRFQAATGEILASLSRSLGDAKPVFEAIVENVLRVFGTRYAAVFIVEGDRLHLRAAKGDAEFEKRKAAVFARFRASFPQRIDYEGFTGKALRSGKVSQLAPVIGNPQATPQAVELAKTFGYDAMLVAPLMREGKAIGAIGTTRPEGKPFDDRALALFEAFAAQAVIAIENARLFHETNEALKRQTATAEILKVISRSPSDVQPVFDTIVRSAVRLCGALFGFVTRFDGEKLHLAAQHNFPSAALEIAKRAYPSVPDRTRSAGRAILTRSVVRIEDISRDPDYHRPYTEKGGWRSVLAVPMMRDGVPLGTISVAWVEPGPISKRHEDLLNTFADQAVVAIENVRLFNETKEALEQQTATGDILRVISGTPTDAHPVFDAIVQGALRIFNGMGVGITLVREDGQLDLVASTSPESSSNFPMALNRDSANGTAILERRVVNVADTEAADAPALARSNASGFRSIAVAPLMRKGVSIGALSVTRKTPGTLADKQLALLQTFADQAVIAIENARLFKETKEALDRQTATAEVLRVIAGTPADAQPVFQAIAESALRVFDAFHAGVGLVEGGEFVNRATAGSPDSRRGFRIPLDRSSTAGNAILDKKPFSVADSEASDAPSFTRESGRTVGFRSVATAPMVRDGSAIGVVTVMRRYPAAFDARQLELLQTFADQAVIAIENARMFNETKEALERQTATSEVLRVISESHTDTAPVFDAIIRSAVQLCGATYGSMVRVDDGVMRLWGHYNYTAEALELVQERYPAPISEQSLVGLAVRTKGVVHSPDFENDPRTRVTPYVKALGVRAQLTVPLMREGEVIGTLNLLRKTPGPFSDAQVEVLKSFAAQAVIAIENVRLFNETKEALERQTATADVLKVISGSPTDVAPVFDAILKSAVTLCDAELAAVFAYDGNLVHMVATHNWPEEALRYFSKIYPSPPSPKLLSGRTILTKAVVEITDSAADPDYDPTSVVTGHWRRMLGAPMLREGRPLGVLVVAWREPGETPQRQVDLLQTFADQAAIAIENVRLFNETKEALDRQTATADILRVISSSQTDLQPVFDTIIRNCVRLGDASFGSLFHLDAEGRIEIGAHHNFDARAEALFRARFPHPLSPDVPYGKAMIEGAAVNVPDFDASAFSQASKERARALGTRAVLAVPLMRQGRAIGAIAIGRREPGAFADAYVSLIGTFADQAVIAIENVRLLNETKEALEQQRASSEILQVIAQSPTDVRPVFEALTARAAHLCEAEQATLVVAEDNLLRPVVSYSVDAGPLPQPSTMIRPSRDYITGRAVVDCDVVNVEDAVAVLDTEFPGARENQRALGFRSMLVVPLMRDKRAIGAIGVWRRVVRRFSGKHVALLKTFADQAVIAIENVRLFNETKEALDQQKASADVLGAISSSIADTQPVFEKILDSCRRLFGGHDTGIGLVGEDGRVHLAAHRGPNADELRKVFPVPLSRESGTGSAILERRVKHYPDVFGGPEVPDYVLRSAEKVDFKSVVFAPMFWDGRGMGAIWVGRNFAGAFTEKQIALLQTFADQAVIAIQNARLFREIQEKSAQLEVANKHKSDFLASMSHELRTPLNAIIGFSEVLSERMFGELNEKQAEYLKDIHESGRHLLSLINDILDLSKIEAGRMELELSRFHLPSALSNAMTLVRERAQRHGIQLAVAIDPGLGELQADERKVKQILLNLLSNAVKFTPDGGRVDVSARKADGKVEIAVKDTGIGIAPEDHAAVFEEFKQVGRDYTRKAEGTGLGLALTRRLVELHGGDIALESAPGKGSTFTVRLPLR